MEWFFAHPEHLLLAISQKDKKTIREFGLRRILKARRIDARGETVKTSMPPKINFSVEEYSEIINWLHYELFSLLFLAEITDDEIKSRIDSDSISDWNSTFKEIPVYTQAVECLVKLVREAIGNVCEVES